eukprot:sb/3464562/
MSNYGSLSPTTTTPAVKTFTVQQALDHMGFGWGNGFIVLSTATAQFVEGIEIMVMGIILPKLRCEWNLTDTVVILLPISTIFAAILGGFIGSYVTTRLGRKTPIIVILALGGIFALLSAGAGNVWSFITLRFLATCAFETMSCIVTVYATETMNTASRAWNIGNQLLAWAVGSFISAILCYYTLETLGWRVVLVILSIPALITASTFIFQPESPFYEVACDRLEDGRKSLDVISERNGRDLPEGELRKHEVGNPQELELSAIPRDKAFVFDSIALLITTCLAFMVWTFSAWGAPRMFNEGYCHETNVTKTEKCHTYSGEALLALSVSTVGEIIGNLVFTVIAALVSRLLSLRIGSVGETLCIISLLICGGRLKVMVDLFLVRFMNAGVFIVILIYLSEYYDTTVFAEGINFIPSGHGSIAFSVSTPLRPAYEHISAISSKQSKITLRQRLRRCL